MSVTCTGTQHRCPGSVGRKHNARTPFQEAVTHENVPDRGKRGSPAWGVPGTAEKCSRLPLLKSPKSSPPSLCRGSPTAVYACPLTPAHAAQPLPRSFAATHTCTRTRTHGLFCTVGISVETTRPVEGRILSESKLGPRQAGFQTSGEACATQAQGKIPPP